MALLTTHGPTTKVQHQISIARANRTLFYCWELYWYVETITTESFSYVGMTAQAAATCQAAMVAAYTKSKIIPSVSIVNNQGTVTYSAITELVADIRTIRDNCGWRVDVNVNDNVKTIEPLIEPLTAPE